MKTFVESINEGNVSIDGMKFTISVYNDKFRGMIIQFIPDGKTLENTSKNEQVDTITKRIDKAFPNFKDVFWYESGSDAAGLNFRINTLKFADAIEKAVK
jgi:hypothetical protein